MGGRGAYSASGIMGDSNPGEARLPGIPLASAALNRGMGAGSTADQAAQRFHALLATNKNEHHAYITESGHMTQLTTSGDTGRVRAATMNPHEKIVATVHNHPSDRKRGGGGTFSIADLKVLANQHYVTGGRVKTAYATAPEGIYKATVTKTVAPKNIERAWNRGRDKLSGIRYTSKAKMWAALNTSVAKEMGKLGIKIEVLPATSERGKLIAPVIGQPF